MTLHEVGSEIDLKNNGRIIIEINDKSVAVIYAEGKAHAFENHCPHKGGPVGEGDIEDCIITCPLHGWQFDVRTGEGTSMPNSKLKILAVKIQDGKVFVEI